MSIAASASAPAPAPATTPFFIFGGRVGRLNKVDDLVPPRGQQASDLVERQGSDESAIDGRYMHTRANAAFPRYLPGLI